MVLALYTQLSVIELQ